MAPEQGLANAKRVIIIDDEHLARQRLRRMVQNQSGYEVVAEGANGEEAVKLCRQFRPDLVFLDIRMPVMDGIAAARMIAEEKRPPAIVFCTAYNEYALEAFSVNAVGYVLKPVRDAQLKEALSQAQKLNQMQLASLQAGHGQEDESVRAHLSVKTHAGIELIPIDEISHFQADNKYVVAFHHGRELVLDDTLKKLEQSLGDRFLRIHRNCLVAKSFIRKLERGQNNQSTIRLEGVEAPLPVSRRHLTQVKASLNEL